MLELPRVSVLVPTKNAGRVIDACMRSIFASDYPRNKLEVIVIDGNSADDTRQILRRYPLVKLLTENGGTRAAACNVGIKHAHGEIIFFTDADCEINKNCIKNLVARYADERIGGVGGYDVPPNNEGVVGRNVANALSSRICFGKFRYSKRFEDGEVYHNPGCCASFRKMALEKTGGYDESLLTAEDVEADWRMRATGYKLIFASDAFVLHKHRSDIKSFFRWMRRYGIGRGQVFRKYRNSFLRNRGNVREHLLSPMIFAPLGLFGALAALVAYGLSSQDYLPALLLAASSAAYYAAGGIEAFARNKDLSALFLVPVLSAIGHAAWSIGLLEGILKPHSATR